MADDQNFQRLVVSLEGRVDKYEKALARARSDTSKQFAGMSKTVSGFESKIGSLGSSFAGLGKSMVTGFVGGLVAGGIAGLVSQVGQLATEVASVGDEARRAGVGVEAFQELKYVAEQNRIGVDSLTDALKELNLRADEWITTGGGSAAEAFQRLGYTADELKVKLQNPSALFSEIIGKLGQLDKAAQIRIADELFGGSGGEKFVQLIEQGEAGIQRTIQEARNLGIVMDSDLIAKAAEVDRQFNAIASTVGTALKGAIVEAAFALQQFIDKFNATTAQQTVTLDNRMRDLGARRVAIENAQLEAGRSGRTPRGATWSSELEDIARQEQAILDELETRRPIVVPPSEALPPSGLPVAPQGGSRSSTVSDTERQATAVQNLIAGLEFERSIIGLNAVETAKLNALRQAGAGATEAQRAQISALVEATYAEQAAADQASESMQQLGDIGTSAANSLVDAFSDGKIEASELLSIVTDIVKQLISAPGAGANFISGLLSVFSGGTGSIGNTIGKGVSGSFVNGALKLAGGGQVRGPGTGRSDSIAANLSDGEFVINAASTKKFRPLLEAINANRPGFALGGIVSRSSAGSGRLASFAKSVTAAGGEGQRGGNIYNIDAKGAQRGVGEEIRDALEQYDKRLPDRMNQIQRDPRKRK